MWDFNYLCTYSVSLLKLFFLFHSIYSFNFIISCILFIFFFNYCGNLSICFILSKRSSLLLLSLTLVQIRIAKLYGVTYYCNRESKNPFLQVIKTVVKKFDINFFYYFDLNYMCLTLYSLMSARYSECHGCSPKKKTCFMHIVTSYYC